MRYHVGISCAGLLNEPPEIARAIFVESATGRPLLSHEAYAMALIWKAKGFEVIPPCDNTDARGYCQGHEIESET